MNPAFFKYLAALLIMGTNGVVASFIDLSSQEIVLLRTGLGSALLILLFLMTRAKPVFWQHKKELFYLAISGAAMGVCFLFLFRAYQLIGVGLASLAYYCGPIIVMVLSPLIFREKLTRGMVLGFLIAVVGIVLVNGQAFQAGKSLLGLFCAAMAAIMYAVLVISAKKAVHITGLENATLQLFFSFLTVAVFVGFTQGFAIQVQTADWLPILVLGFVNTGLGCYCYFSSIGRLPAQTVAIFGYLEPLSSVFYSAVLLKEVLLPAQIIGAALIVGGALLGELSGKRHLSQVE